MNRILKNFLNPVKKRNDIYSAEHVYNSYLDDVLSINNPNFDKWIPLRYHKEREIKETIETALCVLFPEM